MPAIQAWQHIYANVEKNQSPQGRGGFQTLFYSRDGLNEIEVEEMESRLLYFPADSEPVKRLFFTTESGKAVAAQIVALPDPDRLGRKGRYLAHSLIFEPEALTHFEADPFRVFRRFNFTTTVASALEQGDFQSGDIPPVALALPAEPAREIEAARAWSGPELKKLALLALRAGSMARERQVITLAGQPAELGNLLEAAFLALPAALRPLCSFDTYFYRCNLVAAYFWAIGLPEPPASVKFALATASDRRVEGATALEPATVYERWVTTALESDRLAEIVRDRDAAFALGEWLDDRRYNLGHFEAASSELITEVISVNPGPVQAALRRRAAKYLPPALADRVAEFIHRQSSEAVLYRYLRQGFELPALLDFIFQSYAAENFAAPPSEELEGLPALLDKTDHPLLRLFLAYWQDPRRQLPRELGRASEDDYRRFSQTALRLKLVKPLTLLVPGQGQAFLDLYLASDPQDWADLIDALLATEEAACLDRLTDHLSLLSAAELKRVDKTLSRHPETPESFRMAVKQTIADLPPREGLWGRLRGFWPGKG